MKKRVTIKDIAKHSGYSANCVSRALMDATDISEKTKQRIREIANELGYVRNGNAAALRQGSSKTVAVLFDSLLNPFYSIMTNYLCEKLSSKEYQILTFKSNYVEFDYDVAKSIASANVDGLISFLKPTPKAQALLNGGKVATVVIGRKTDGLCSAVVLDNYQGGKLAAQNLLARGFKKPLYMGETEGLDCSRDRAYGFRDEFAKVGIQPQLVFLDVIGTQRYARTFEKIYNSAERPDCVFCFCDSAAYELISYMDSNNITDVAVIGFDNIQQEISFPGKLTTIAYDKQALVDKSVEMLFRHIAGNAEICEAVLGNLFVTFPQTA